MAGTYDNVFVVVFGENRDQLQVSDSKNHLNKLAFMSLTEKLYKLRITSDNACKIIFN